jgi:tryptophan synthase alpha chain
MADGPVIQRASERALKHGFGLGDILQTVSAAQHEMNGVPVVLFSYFNPLLQFGLGRLCREASESGIDAVLVTDLIPEEAADFSVAVRDHGMEMIFLVAPTSSDERLRMVSERAGGFIYAVSRAGVTGARADLSQQAELLVERVRRFSDLPVAVGFGISTAEQVSDTLRYADAAVVGSAIVSLIETLDGSPNLVLEVGRFCRELLSGGRLPNRF